VRKAQKQIAEENKRKAVIITAEQAELAASKGKTFCISRVDVGLDVAAVREAVTKAMDKKVIADFNSGANLVVVIIWMNMLCEMSYSCYLSFLLKSDTNF